MKLLVLSIIITAVVTGVAVIRSNDEPGRMPEIVVTAPRYSVNEIDSVGQLSEIVVTAERYIPTIDSSTP
jgi:hypothetical protein